MNRLSGYSYSWMGQEYLLLPASAVPFDRRAGAIDATTAAGTIRDLMRDPLARYQLIEILGEVSGPNPAWSRTSDTDLLTMIDRHLEHGMLLVLSADANARGDSPGAGAAKATLESRLVQAIMAGRKTLPLSGREYRLCEAWNLLSLRDRFQVVPQGEARELFARWQTESGLAPDAKQALTAAAPLLIDRPPVGQPHGIFLLRQASTGGAPVARSQEQVVTPSALRKASQKKLTFYSVTVVDEVGAAVDGIDVTLTIGGRPMVIPTDASGKVRVDEVDASGTATATLKSLKQVRAKMKSRWKDPREPRIPTGTDVAIRELGSKVDGVSVPEATAITIVLTPFFECREINGAHFDFGRSFVRSSAIAHLADIAEALGGSDELRGMIFGHTDLSGPEALNKELSERRAKAIHALLTHDADAWEELFSGTADGPQWKEKWDVEEVQHMLNALGVTDDGAQPLDEDGVRGPSTKQALHRFQRGDYPDKPAEQGPLPESDLLGVHGRRALFLAYAKRISRQPIDAARFSKVGNGAFMGCGEFNPLSISRRDAESRRTVVFLFAPAAEPQGLPCKLRALGPCQANSGPLASAPPPDGKPPYRCKIYQKVAKRCPCQGGVDLSHDLLVRVPVPLSKANDLPHVFLIDSDDGTVHIEKKVSADARALGDASCEIHFTGLPETHSYRLTYDDGGVTSLLFDFTPYEELPDVVLPGPLAGDTDGVAKQFARLDDADQAFADSVAPVTDPNADPDDSSGEGADGDARGAEA
jgi:outer membrane protein OmpA-like peptidoglycan-associated protein